ncbi:hypothetical protein ACFW2X_31825 [Streptomyces antibioticus]|uniref:hypothetical protein n=1 Tax=Streptomyces antibioticus TaxID=1890 RepID=UPI0036958243
MFRGTAARAAVAFVFAVLLALPFLTPSPSFAHAYTAHKDEIGARPGTAPSAQAPREAYVTVRDCGHLGGAADPLRSRDRHRVASTTAPAPQEPERAPLAPESAARHGRDRPAEPYDRPSRPPAARSPEALQVFRC